MTNADSRAPRSVLVTGALGGIGRAVCQHFAGEGAHIVLHDRLPPEQANVQACQDMLREKGAASTRYFQADLRSTKQIDGLFAALREAGVSLDVLVNNAGIQLTAPVENFELTDWNDIIAINLTAVYRCSQLALADMRRQGGGRIVNLASVHGLVGSPYKSAYVAAKHGVVGLTKVLALETAEQRITVNAIAPGWTETPILEPQIAQRMQALNRGRDEAIRHLVGEKQPTKAFVLPEQVAALVGFLSSSEAASMTGTVIPMDGGWTCQ